MFQLIGLLYQVATSALRGFTYVICVALWLGCHFNSTSLPLNQHYEERISSTVLTYEYCRLHIWKVFDVIVR